MMQEETKSTGTRAALTPHVLLVDDEPNILLSFGTMLKSAGIRSVTTLDDSRTVMPTMEKRGAELVILDLAMPYVTGEEILVELKQQYPETPVIVITAVNDLDKAVECMKNGAVDYLIKPVEKNRFLSSVMRVLETNRLQHQVDQLKESMLSEHLRHPQAFSHMVTGSPKMKAIFKYVEAIAGTPKPLTITGETGVGKELMARAFHKCSRPGKNFVAVNAAGLDDTMFSDTLFGHKKGAFTGADGARSGLISRASGGTVFLDEIGDLNPQSQVKLLRLIQEKEYYPLGSDIPVKTDAHIIVATNRDFTALMENGSFRRDLYYRLSVHHIHVPPLRERSMDIPLLLDHFIAKSAAALNKKPPPAPPHLLNLLKAYEFPGNIRQFETVVYDAVSRYTSGLLPLDSFKQMTGRDFTHSPGEPGIPLDDVLPPEKIFGKFPTLKEMEDYLLDEALKRAGDNQGVAAGFLGITRQALNKRLNRRRKNGGNA